MSEYPLQILSNGIDITSMLSSSPLGQGVVGSQNAPEEGMVTVRELITPLVSGISSNDLASLKAYLESDAASAAQHASSIEYLYGVSPQDSSDTGRTAATARSTRIPPWRRWVSAAYPPPMRWYPP